MTALIVAMLVCLGVAVAVVGLVAIPARRQGRHLLTPRAAEVADRARPARARAADDADDADDADIDEGVAGSSPRRDDGPGPGGTRQSA